MSPLQLTYTLTAGTPEDINKVQQNFMDIVSGVGDRDGAYRTIHEATGFFNTDKPAATYLFTHTGVMTNAVASTVVPYAKRLNEADFAIAALTTKLRVVATVTTNATAPATNFTFGLAPIATLAGGVDLITYSAGAAVAGGNVAINTPAASTATVGVGSDFSVPANGLYALFVSAGPQANNNFCGLHAELQQRWV